jgi:hypothetical protein
MSLHLAWRLSAQLFSQLNCAPELRLLREPYKRSNNLTVIDCMFTDDVTNNTHAVLHCDCVQGPFWNATTLVFLVAITTNLSSWLAFDGDQW